MSSFLLFCIAQLPTSVIDMLLQTPKHNFFSHVRDSTQTTFDPFCTSPPIGPFTSDFQDREQIRNFIVTHLDDPPSGSDLEACQYTLLDERSVTDQTVVLAHSYSSVQMRDPDTMTEDELAQWEIDCDEEYSDDSWREWRVRFDDAESLSTHLCFESDFTVKLYNDDFVAAHTDADGVLQLKSALKAYENAFSDDQMYALSAESQAASEQPRVVKDTFESKLACRKKKQLSRLRCLVMDSCF